MSEKLSEKWDGWLVIGVVFFATLLALFYPFFVKAQEMHKGHEHFHDDFYREWKTAEGYSCCNSKTRSADGDCGPIDDARIRTRNETLEVFIDNEWVPVEPQKVRPYFAPDYSSHLCHRGKRILCLVVGGGT